MEDNYVIAQQRIAEARHTNSPRLNLSKLGLTELPPELFDLTNLRVLWLSGNGLTDLPPEFGKLNQLVRLRLNENELSTVPVEISLLSQLQSLRLNINQLTAVPVEFSQLSQLQYLSLSNNQLTAVPVEFSQLSQLQSLWLDNNQLTAVPVEFSQLSQLQYLSLYNNQLTAVPVEFSQLSQLQSLWLDNNQLTAVPVEFSQLSQLQSLSLGNNQLTAVPVEFSRLSQLQYLYLYNNQLTAVPVEFSQLSQLQSLWLSNNQLTAVPVEFSRLSQLQSLSLGNNQLTAVPAEFSQLSQLQSLWLDNNQLTAVPVEFSQLSQLQSLRLDNNQLTAVPAEFSQLSQLQSLWLDNNQLTAVPVEFSQLSQLQSLSLGNNQLTAVPVEFSRLSQLQYLYLYNNQLTAVPVEFSQLSQLQSLWLSNNQLTAVPVEFSRLSQLQYLDLSNNQLTAVPVEFSQLSQLQYLLLSNNQLTAVPVEFSQLSQLQSLWLSNNQLTAVPVEFSQLSNLRGLSLNDNPDLKIPPEVVEEGTKALLDFIGQGPQSHWVSKLMLVGEGRHGKSSLLRALLGQEFDANLSSTHGMLIGRLPLPHPRHDGIEMELSTWDFGGQQIYHAMHQFFLTDRSLYVLVWDGQRRWEECKIEAWLESLALRAPNAPVILVATHCPAGGRPADPPFAQLTERFPNLIPIHFQVDNQTGDGIAELCAQLIETAANLPLMGELSPPTWTAVKETLRTRHQTEKACTPAALEDVIGAHGITAPASQKRLMRFLNELGEIIHYPENPVLRDTVILDTEWVSQTISLVLDDKEVERGLGYFRRETMDRIWRHLDLGMPERMLNLMEEFDLSYRTLDDREISIIVERLQQNPPEDWDKEWNSVSVPFQEITMEFKLETALPPGIPSWFIARQHQYTRNTHWRRGAVFADDRQVPKHWALIEAYPEKSLVRLSVRGPVPHDFFSRMRRGLWETFNRYEGLREGKFRVVETVPCPGQLESAPCTYEHEVTDLERKLERGKNTMTCNRCDEEIAVPELLLGIRFEPTYEKLEAIHSDVLHTRERVEEIHSLVSTLQGSHAELFNAFQHIEEMQSPYVFVLRSGSYDSDVIGLLYGSGMRGSVLGELRHRLWKEKMELQLYCQHPGEWHPLGYNRGKDDPATGLYQVEVNGELLMLLAPYLPKLAKLLKYAKPFAQVAKAMAGLPPVAPEVDALKNMIESDHGLMERLVKNLPSPEDLAKQSEKVRSLEDSAEAKMMRGLGDAANPTEARGALLRQLRRLLLEKDKDQIWGGLQRKYVKAEGHHLWLCPDHLAEYKF